VSSNEASKVAETLQDTFKPLKNKDVRFFREAVRAEYDAAIVLVIQKLVLHLAKPAVIRIG
jgi:hypothetical protein